MSQPTIMTHRISSLGSAETGRTSMAWAESRMPVTAMLRRSHRDERPLAGHRIVGSSHVTKEAAVLIHTLQAFGADVAWCASNPLTTQDDIAALLVEDGVRLFAWSRMSRDEYYDNIDRAVSVFPDGPTLCLDDGGDLMIALHDRFPELAARVRGGTDKTTSGVTRVRALARDGRLRFPIVAVNDSLIKWEVDNVHGTGQSTIDGILRATSILLAGKTIVVAGFGHVGRGIASRARGMGAHVIVTEVRPTSALRAIVEGYRVLSMEEAVKVGDIFCTATGMKHVIVGPHLDGMKDGAILCNAGHFDCEIDLTALAARTARTDRVRPHVVAHRQHDGRCLYVLGEGRVVNLAAAEGNASEVMDLTFAAQALALLDLVRDAGTLPIGVHPFSPVQDERVARLKLETMGVETDTTADAGIAHGVEIG